MSLFNETWARADRAEKALELAQRRIAELEAALKDVRADKTSDYWWKRRPRYDNPRDDRSQHNNLNALSDNEVKELFSEFERRSQTSLEPERPQSEAKYGSWSVLGRVWMMLPRWLR